MATVAQQPEGRASIAGLEVERDIELATINNPQPRELHTDVADLTGNRWRQLLGANPFKTSYFSLYRPMTRTRDRVSVVAAVILSIAAGLPLPIIGVIFARIINQFPPPEDQLRKHVTELLGVGAGYFVVTAAYTITWGLIGEHISWTLRKALVERLLGLDQTYFDVQDPDIAGLLTEKCESIQIGTSEKVGIFLQSISYFIAAFVVGFILNARLTAILFAAVIPVMTIIVVCGSSTVTRFAKQASEYTEQAAKLAESTISAVKVIQAFGMADEMGKQHYQLLQNATAHAIRKSTASAVMLGAVYFVAYAANGLAFYEGSKMAAGKPKGDAGSIYAVVFLILDASFVLGQFGPFLGAFGTAAAAGEKVYEVLDCEQPKIDSYSETGHKISDESLKKDIRIENVSFAYPSRSAFHALDQISLTVKGGAMNAIVGESGSGKSSIISLLLRLYDPTHGQVLIDGKDMRGLHLSSLRKQIALVDQEPVLFSGSILDNISHGIEIEGLSEQQVLERCERAAVEANVNFLGQLPQNIHTKVGSGGGAQLSGGQKQRICLARALVKRPKLLLLDEPTSALDSTSEALVMNAIRNFANRGSTVVMVTHRLSTAMDFDNIAIMASGKVIEQGSHDELLACDGVYKSMVEAQALADTPASEIEPVMPGSADVVVESAPHDSQPNKKRPSVTSSKLEEGDMMPKKLKASAILSRCLRLTRGHWTLLALALCLSIISGSIIIGEAITFGHVVQLLNFEPSSPGFLGRASFLCLMFFMLAIVALVAHCGSGTAFGIASSHFVAKVQHISLTNILRQDMPWFNGRSAHSLVASLSSDAAQLSCLSGVAIGTVFTVTTSISGGIILSHVVAWKIAVVLLSAVPVMILAGYTRLRVLALAETRHRSAYNEAAAIASEACSNMRTVASLGRESKIFQIYRAALKQPYQKGVRFTLISNVLLASSLSITYFVYALAYWWGSKQVREGDSTVLQFFIVMPALLFSAQSAGQVFSLSPEISRASIAARNVFQLHDQEPKIMSKASYRSVGHRSSESLSSLSSAKTEKLALTKPTQRGSVRLQDVTLTYSGRKDGTALCHVDLAIAPGEMVAVVGPSGAGKSSLVSLIERFYDVDQGALLIDGQDVRNIPVSKHRDRLGLVPQEPDLFPGSVAYNIRLGAADGQVVTDEDIYAVCKECGIHNFISSLPEGYNTECGRNGSKLSGGQKQRIAIARALIRSPDILLLDEYTSALDAHSERDVKQAVDNATKGRTTIVVAHRLSTVQHANRIVVLDKGRIVEIGTHGELVSRSGIYAGMVAAQALS